ncbi:DUF1800 domain-containing protein [Streptacidiphilus anmyonensis]|uniref:DUF1800 domain-containing protein n=1 Tax=Streptacidiphilus anmyonensis TaxID=405782 RepID=UPI000694C4D6|nr:DUF1800 domain-containing protein [Streptacidiphilus anmyonensis]
MKADATGAAATAPSTRAQVAHLLRRAGFGGRADEIDAAEQAGYEATVAALLAGPVGSADPGVAATPPPAFADIPAPGRDPAARKQANRQRAQQYLQLASWWLDRMVRASGPLVEKRTWFWHGHWATSVVKVRSAALMLRQNQTLRSLGGGDFGALAQAMVRDPALAVWLDEAGSTRQAPNENLARELMELFTLGVGHYTEDDVRAAARALTGWRLDRTSGQLVFVPAAHDDTPKTVLGRTANYDSVALVDLLVDQPASHAWVVTRMWNRYAAPGPVPADVMSRLQTAYGSGRDLTALLRALLLDPVFRGPAVVGALAKQPVEYVVGALRALGVTPDDADRTMLLAALRRLGQVPFEPPNVGGWPSGDAWLTAAAVQARLDFARWAVTKADLGVVSSAPVGSRVDATARLLGLDAWSARSRAALQEVAGQPRTLVALALAAPEYAVN